MVEGLLPGKSHTLGLLPGVSAWKDEFAGQHGSGRGKSKLRVKPGARAKAKQALDQQCAGAPEMFKNGQTNTYRSAGD